MTNEEVLRRTEVTKKLVNNQTQSFGSHIEERELEESNTHRAH